MAIQLQPELWKKIIIHHLFDQSLEHLESSIQSVRSVNKIPYMNIACTYGFSTQYKGASEKVFSSHKVKMVDLLTWETQEGVIHSEKNKTK